MFVRPGPTPSLGCTLWPDDQPIDIFSTRDLITPTRDAMPNEQSRSTPSCVSCSAILPSDAAFCLTCGTHVGGVNPPTPEPAASDPLREQLEKALGVQYEIERLLGRGGMGAVYLARERLLDRLVAIKVLPPDVSQQAPDSRARFMREAQTAAQLTHRHIVPLHSIGEEDGTLFIVMGFGDGESLKAVLNREGRLSEERTRRILGELADALAYAHQHGIVHRDMKPDNVMIERESGKAVLTDFGIAKYEAKGELTGPGFILGTPQYMSPEQAGGDRHLDGRSDLYSLGVLGFRMLSGRLPFEGVGVRELLVQHIADAPPPLGPLAPGISEDLIFAIMSCLAKRPSDRWPDAASLRNVLVSPDQVVKLAAKRSWYDGVLLSYVLPAMFLLSVLVVGSTVGRRASAVVRASVTRAHLHRAGAATARSASEQGGALGALATPVRWVVFGDGLPRYAARFFVTTLVTTLVLTALAAVVIAAIARFGQGASSGGNRRIATLLFRQPQWWAGWVPRQFRHPAVAEIRKGHPQWLVSARTVIDLAALYSLCIVLPVLVVMMLSSSTELVDLSMHEWPYVNRAWSGASLVDRRILLQWLAIGAGALTYVWATRRGLSRRQAWRLANGDVFVPSPASLSFWRELDESHVIDAGTGRRGAAGEPRTIEELVAIIDRLAEGLVSETGVGTKASVAVRSAALNVRAIDAELSRLEQDADPDELERIEKKIAGLDAAGGADAGGRTQMRQLLEQQRQLLVEMAARQGTLEARRARCADMLRQLWRELSDVQASTEGGAAAPAEASAKIEVLCADINRMAGPPSDATVRVQD